MNKFTFATVAATALSAVIATGRPGRGRPVGHRQRPRHHQ